MRILIVDDEAMITRLLQRYLSQWQHDVIEANDGKRAWELFQAEPVPMVITDWSMPEMNGIDLLRKIRSHPLGSSVYALLLTGRANKSDVVEGMEAGADDFISKPFDKDELRVRIREGERIVLLEQALLRARTECVRLRAFVQSIADGDAGDRDSVSRMLAELDDGPSVLSRPS